MDYPFCKCSVSLPVLISIALCTSIPLTFALPLQAQETEEQLLSQLAEANNELQQSEADRLLDLGVEQYQVSEFREAIRSWEQALEIYRAIGDCAREGVSLGNLGAAYDALGQYQQAIDLHEQHLSIARNISDRAGESQALGNLGSAYLRLGQYQQAIGLFEQQLIITRSIDDRIGEGRALGNLGIAHDGVAELRDEF